MEKSKITLKDLKDPSVFRADKDSVDVIQTHISYVVLTGNYAYKIKKPVDFGFLDFSTLDKRKHFCEEEIKLNNRLCPQLYIGVVSINKNENGELRVNGDGEIVEYAVKMRHFPQNNIMKNLLQKEKIDEPIIENLCNTLVTFYSSQNPSEEIKKFGKKEYIQKNTDENFDQTKDFIDKTISKKRYGYIKKITNNFLDKKEKLFDKRVKNNKIYDCHGDLHSGNIVILDSKVCIFDCIEFNKRFRYSDVASDIGFLSMDLDFLNHPFLSSYLIKEYIEKSEDKEILTILNFYKCYRAYVRGKVTSFKLDDPNIDKKDRKNTKKTAKKYFDLSNYYAKLLSIELENKKPILFVVGGMTGTGKTTFSLRLSLDYNAARISTDEIRKQLAGVNKYEKHHDDINTGLYSPEKTRETYSKVMEKAKNLLKNNENVVLDATFQKESYRDMAEKIAKETDSIYIPLECFAPEKVVKKWLEERVKKKTVSDGRWEVYQSQKDSFEHFTKEENPIKVDMSKKSYKYRMNIFEKIVNKVKR